MPPIAGLQDIWPIRSRFIVTNAVCAPSRAAADAASQPAWPPPITITSNIRRKPSSLAYAKRAEDFSQDIVCGRLSGISPRNLSALCSPTSTSSSLAPLVSTALASSPVNSARDATNHNAGCRLSTSPTASESTVPKGSSIAADSSSSPSPVSAETWTTSRALTVHLRLARIGRSHLLTAITCCRLFGLSDDREVL